MKEANIVTTRQLKAIDELFASGGNENAVLQKLSISPSKWQKWQTQKPFNRALKEKMKTLNQQGQMLLLQHSSWVTARLLELCNSQKEEVSRRACLNVLQLNNETVEKNTLSESEEPQTDEEEMPLTDEQASKLLAVMADPTFKEQG